MISKSTISKVAIVIPCWNCEKEIKEMLDSIILQTYQNWVVYCVDDQSTDNTLQVLKEYSQKDNRIDYMVRSRLPKGAQTCRNIGLELSNDSEFICFFDSDDIIAPYCIEQRVQYMEHHPELDFGVFPAKTFTNNIWDEGNGCCYGFPFYEDALGAMLNWTLPMVGWTNIYRKKSLLLKNHKWDINILSMQDSDFNIQSIIKGLKFNYGIKERAKIDYFYRVGNNSTTNKIFTTEHFHSHIYLLNKIIGSLSNEEIKKYKDSLERYFFTFAEIMKGTSYYSELINNPWVRENKSFYLRLQLWNIIKFRHTSFLFHNIRKNRFQIHQYWKKQMNAQIKCCRN